jgi:hypothetical protein
LSTSSNACSAGINCCRGAADNRKGNAQLRLSSAIPALSAATSFFCAEAAVPQPALRTSASDTIKANRKAHRLPGFMMRAPSTALRPPPMRPRARRE